MVAPPKLSEVFAAEAKVVGPPVKGEALEDLLVLMDMVEEGRLGPLGVLREGGPSGCRVSRDPVGDATPFVKAAFEKYSRAAEETDRRFVLWVNGDPNGFMPYMGDDIRTTRAALGSGMSKGRRCLLLSVTEGYSVPGGVLPLGPMLFAPDWRDSVLSPSLRDLEKEMRAGRYTGKAAFAEALVDRASEKNIRGGFQVAAKIERALLSLQPGDFHPEAVPLMKKVAAAL